VLYVNGVKDPSEPPIMDCSSPFGATRAYKPLFSNTGIHHVGRAHMFILEIFTEGFCVLGFDLTPNREADKEHIILPCQGKVNIETHFKKPLREHVRCIFLMKFLDTTKSTTPETLQ